MKVLRMGLIGAGILSVVFLLGLRDFEIEAQPLPGVSGPGAAQKPEVQSGPSTAATGLREAASVETLTMIGQKNIFNSERKEFAVPAPEQQAKPIVRPQIILYGVAISDQLQMASIVNPGRPMQKGERETKTVKIGDPIGDYRVAKILPDRITMQAAGDSFEVLLFDPRAPKKRPEGQTPAQPAALTSVQQAGAAAPPGSSPSLPAPGLSGPGAFSAISTPLLGGPQPAAGAATPSAGPQPAVGPASGSAGGGVQDLASSLGRVVPGGARSLSGRRAAGPGAP